MIAALAPALEPRRLHRAPAAGAGVPRLPGSARRELAARAGRGLREVGLGGRGGARLRGRACARGRRARPRSTRRRRCSSPAPTTSSRPLVPPCALCEDSGDGIGGLKERRLGTALDDGPGRRRGRRRDPRLLRPRLPLRQPVPLSEGIRAGRRRSRLPRPLFRRALSHGTSDLRHHQRRPQPGRHPLRPDDRRRLAGADRLHLPRRPPPHRRPVPGRLRDGRLLLPLHRHRRLRDRAAAGVPRGRPRARAGDQGRRAAGAPADASRPARTASTRSRRDYLRCPQCQRRLKDPCPSCGKPVDPRWALCPLLRDRARRRQRRAPARRRRRRRARGASRDPAARSGRRNRRSRAASASERPKAAPARERAKQAPARREGRRERPTQTNPKEPRREPDADPRQA